MDKEASKQQISNLIDKYQRLFHKGKIDAYNEAQTRNEFIEPLFEYLGWDMRNLNNKGEVTTEENVSRDRVDLAFRVDGIPAMYLEAKSMRTDLDLEQYSRQAINYAWNKGVTYALLTDFESIKLYNADAESKRLIDKLIFEIPNTEYVSDFDRLWLLSKESFRKGLLDEYAQKYGKMKKRLKVNEKLFRDLTEIRETLTDAFGQWNKVSKELLEEGIQRIIDRLVFIRVLEDRRLEPPLLKEVLREWQKNQSRQFFLLLAPKFRELDELYDSNIFQKHACDNWEEYSQDFKKVIDLLYGTDVIYTYDFKEIPADILGGVYESYLGYISRTKEFHDKTGAKLEGQRKRKQQGIYYTPQYIVDFITEQTLGEKLKECNSILDLKKIRVLDPACGSGSFLTKALISINNKYKEFGNPGNQYTKSEILLTNIYGVDLDSQAIELSKLSLLIETLDQRQKLPDITPHIREGNSLISGTDSELIKFFGSSFRDKKPFNWHEEFPDVFKNGGFDVIVGNPPWGAHVDENAKFFGAKFPESTQRHKDTYKIFIDIALQLLKPEGYLGFIVPNTFLYQPRYEDIKKIINQYENIVINLGEKVFSNVELPSCILIVQKKKSNQHDVIDLTRISRTELALKIRDSDLKSIGVKSETFVKNTGLTFDSVFLLKDAGVQYASVGAGKAGKGESDLPKRIFSEKKDQIFDTPFYTGSNINRDGWWIDQKVKSFFRSKYKDILKQNEWVHFTKEVFESPKKLVWRQTADTIHAAIMDFRAFFGKTIHAALIKDEYQSKISFEYCLAIFNSNYIKYLYQQKVLETGKLFPQVKLRYLRDLPFVTGNKTQQKELSDLAKKMISLQKEKAESTPETSRHESLQREIKSVDQKIDEKVYKLYGLTDEEINIVEAAV